MFANVVSTPATFRPPVTTLFHNRAITNPNAAARDVDIVFRTSDIETFRSSAISKPGTRRGNRDRMGVRENLPDRLHRLECGDLGGRERVALLDMSRADRADRRWLETDSPGGHRATAHVRLAADVDHLRHC